MMNEDENIQNENKNFKKIKFSKNMSEKTNNTFLICHHPHQRTQSYKNSQK